MSFCLYNKKNITRRLEDMNFIFSWQKQYFTNERIKFISSRHRVVSSIYRTWVIYRNDIPPHFILETNCYDIMSVNVFWRKLMKCLRKKMSNWSLICHYRTEGVICRLQVAGCRLKFEKELNVLNGLQIFPSPY